MKQAYVIVLFIIALIAAAVSWQCIQFLSHFTYAIPEMWLIETPGYTNHEILFFEMLIVVPFLVATAALALIEVRMPRSAIVNATVLLGFSPLSLLALAWESRILVNLQKHQWDSGVGVPSNWFVTHPIVATFTNVLGGYAAYIVWAILLLGILYSAYSILKGQADGERIYRKGTPEC
jgi:hypothetical protein